MAISYKRRIVTVCAVVVLLFACIQLLSVYTTNDFAKRPMTQLREYLPQKVFERQPVTEVPQKKLVLIVTYMRSGSSLTGDILQQSPGAFYVYEPFRSLYNKANSTIYYVNGTIRQPPHQLSYEMKMAAYHWFSCQLRKLPKAMLTDGFLSYGIKTKSYIDCIKQKGVANRTLHMHGCISQLQHVCQQSPTIVIKTIRMDMEDTKFLLKEFPGLKIMHLVRDPRATLFSEAKFGLCSPMNGGQHGCSSWLCGRVETDVVNFDRLSLDFTGRLGIVRYEDIARSPIETSKIMYKFLGLDFTDKVGKYVFNITMAGNPNNCVICTVRSNSSEHIDTWKRKMKPQFIEIINNRCNFILKRFNFDVFPAVA